ncbi:acyl-CoA N-acyltransferase [Martensiomyces pterosporus]|nr:acyl-CoA N-acyltransferase [Martensiomyces pterosporus]
MSDRGKAVSVNEEGEIKRVVLGKYSIGAWYSSPYPAEYKQGPDLCICERCLKYMKHRKSLQLHSCTDPFPRGKLIYEDASALLYEVDGKEHSLYCQNLCLLSKLFLDQKTIYYDIGGFLFYILLVKTGDVQKGSEYSFAGYFSKEKASIERNNLACILVLPPFRGQNLGQLLIELSYELTKLEHTTGGPEQPLSAQGFHSYRSYWRRAVIQALLGESRSAHTYIEEGHRAVAHHGHGWEKRQRVFSLSRISRLTGIRIEDVLFILDDLGLLGFWLGRHIVCIADETIRRVVAERRIHLALRMDPDGLLVGRSDGNLQEPQMDADASSESENESSDNAVSANSENGTAGVIMLGHCVLGVFLRRKAMIHAEGMKIQTLVYSFAALDAKYDEYYKGLPKFRFKSCKIYYDAANEGTQ